MRRRLTIAALAASLASLALALRRLVGTVALLSEIDKVILRGGVVRV